MLKGINRMCVTLALAFWAAAAVAVAGETMPLIDLTASGVAERCVPSSDQVTFTQSDEAAAPGLIVSIAAGKAGYPGLGIKPKGTAWDLSEFGRVEARITNTGDRPLTVILRVDNAGEWSKEPWNTESVGLKPGETRTAKVIFGYHYGLKPGYKLDPSKVVQVLFFTGKVTQPLSFRIESITAAGATGEKPPVRPQDVRIKPVNGYVLGDSVKIDAAKQIEAKDRVVAEIVTEGESQALRLTYPANNDRGQVFFRPPIGRWDFHSGLRSAREGEERRPRAGHAGRAGHQRPVPRYGDGVRRGGTEAGRVAGTGRVVRVEQAVARTSGRGDQGPFWGREGHGHDLLQRQG